MFRSNSTTKHRQQAFARRRVDWKSQEDLEAMVLASMGFPARTIADEVGLSINQVNYRCRKSGIKVMDYRRRTSGTVGGTVAARMIGEARNRFRGLVRNHLHQELPHRRELTYSRGR